MNMTLTIMGVGVGPMASGVRVGENGPVLDDAFDEGAGGVLYNRSGYGNDGKAVHGSKSRGTLRLLIRTMTEPAAGVRGRMSRTPWRNACHLSFPACWQASAASTSRSSPGASPTAFMSCCTSRSTAESSSVLPISRAG